MNFDTLLERAREVRMTEDEKQRQRQSFAYGTTKIENERVTREIVHRAVEDERKR